MPKEALKDLRHAKVELKPGDLVLSVNDDLTHTYLAKFKRFEQALEDGRFFAKEAVRLFPPPN